MNIFTIPNTTTPTPILTSKKKINTNQMSLFDWILSITKPIEIEQTIETIYRNYRIKDSDLVFGGTIEKIKCNIEAIKTLKKIEEENREATAEEKSILAKYTGWGGLAQVFQFWEDTYKNQRKELESILTKDEYESIKASTPNAHYTPPEIVRFIYSALIKMGFKKGRIIDPSMGTGFFIGLTPDTIAKESKITGIEIDSISGRIAKQLYPDADIRIIGFEEVKLPDNFFDLAVSNIPFGNYKVHDPRYNKYRANIHDYFFLKAIDIVRPGGIVAFITSRFTMDKKDPKIRKALHEKADLIIAIRLPNTAFKAIADTEVVTDIVFLQKRDINSIPKGHVWLETSKYISPNKDECHINEYFDKNPHMILGTIAFERGMYGRDELTINPKGDIKEALNATLQLVPEGIFSEPKQKKTKQIEQNTPAPDCLKEGAFTIINGKLYKNTSGKLIPHEVPDSTAKRIEGMIKIRDAVKTLLHDEMKTSEESSCNIKRAHLNALYDDFIRKYGYINSKENKAAFSEDPDYPLLLSLEIYDPDTKTATKADIFSNRVIHPIKKIKRTDTAKEALLVSLNELGKVDLQRIAELTGKTEREIISELEGLIFKNPNGGQWETAEEYLSGNVREKLEIAKSAAIIDPEFKKNVKALNAVQPKDIDFTEICATLGSPWIPASDIKQFISELLEITPWRKDDIIVNYLPSIGTWIIEITKETTKQYINEKVENTKKWGTTRYTALELIEDGLNHKIPTVYDTIDKGKNVINIKETEAAREKLYLIKEKFKEWIWQDQKRRERLVKLYNEMFNSLRMRTFDGSHLTLPGASANITLYPHQKNAIWRIIQTGNTLLGHSVGAGKTYVMVASAMEMKRLGLVTKPLITVPNHLLEQFTSEFLRLYPLANVLAATKDDFTPAKRKALMAKIATNNWDAVIVTHSSFEKIPVSKELTVEHIREQITELEDAITQFGSKRSKTVKNLEKAKKRLEAKIKERLNEKSKDDGVTFEELGVDMLLVDEADMFKNLFFSTKMTRIAGLPNTESNRAFDLYVKVNWLNKRRCPVIFATGTPVSNTMAELYTMQRYLQPDTLKQYNIAHFDAWAHNFGEIVTAFEIAPDGSGYKLRSRFARFVNLPELMSIFRTVADIQTVDTLNIERPDIKNGKPITITTQANEELRRYVKELVERAEKIRKGHVLPHEDNMLCVTTDGRKAALDMRLVGGYKDDPNGKVNKAVQNIYKIWERTKDIKGTQLVFCDISTPKSGRFNVYDDIKDKLVKMGIPQNEIAFIHTADTDQKKKLLFDKVNDGSVRILIGSTEKMGTGTNVQKRLVALHHLDAPWRPRDIEQREGRILRQGNTNREVEIYRYVTEGSFDAYMWQTLESKARFIAQIMTNEVTTRTADDIEGKILTYAEVKALASGNPLVIEKFKVDTEVKRLENLKSQYITEKYRMQSEISYLLPRIENLRTKIEQYEKDLMIRNIQPEFSMVIDNVIYTDRKSAGSKIISKALELKGFDTYQKIGRYSGFDLYIKSSSNMHTTFFIIAKGNAEHIGNISDSDIGTIQSLDYSIRNIEEKINEMKSIVAEYQNKLTSLQAEINKPFQYEEKLKELTLRQEQIDKQLDLDKNEIIGELEEKEKTLIAV